MQKCVRGWFARQAMQAICALEDHILQKPTPGFEAVERLQQSPRVEEEQTLAATGTLHGGTTDELWEELHSLKDLKQLPLGRLEECDEENLEGRSQMGTARGAAALLGSVIQTGEVQDTSSVRAQQLGVTPLQLGLQPSTGAPSPAARSRQSSKQQQQQGSRGPSKQQQLQHGSDLGTTSKSQLGGTLDRTSRTGGDPTASPAATLSPAGPERKRLSRQGTATSLGSRGSRGSRTISKPSQGSRLQSKTLEAEEPPEEFSVSEEALAYRFGLVECVKDPYRYAQLVLQFFDVEALLPVHLARIAAHHRLRRRNLLSRVKLRLLLVQHGESFRVPPPSSSPAAARMAASGGTGGAARELTPAGWAQVTRTGWGLRLCPEHTPSVVLCSSVLCCSQTAERLRVLSDDQDVLEAAADRSESTEAGQENKVCTRHPEAIRCPELDFPGVGGPALALPLGGAPSLAPVIYNITEAIAQAVGLGGGAGGEGDAPVPAVLLVAGGALLEAFIACLNSHLPVKERQQFMATGRMGGGDAVLLESPTMFRVVGETDEEARLRPSDELWRNGLRKSKWHVIKHITGDGRRPWGEAKKPSAELHADDGDLSIKRNSFGANAYDTRDEWKRYCGDPLILSQKEFSNLCERAGSLCRPVEKMATDRIRPLVKGFKSRPPPAAYEEHLDAQPQPA